MRTPEYNPRSRRGIKADDPRAAAIAANAREAIVTRALAREGLRAEDMSDDELTAFRRRVQVENIAKARAVQALKRQVRLAEEQAAAEAWAAKQQLDKAMRAERKVDRAKAKYLAATGKK